VPAPWEISGNARTTEKCRIRFMAHARQEKEMSKLKEVTDFMRYEVADMQKQAEAVHVKAMQVKAQFGNVLDSAYSQLDETDKELAELQAAMGLSTNFPPAGE
jgi:hypothetical protein